MLIIYTISSHDRHHFVDPPFGARREYIRRRKRTLTPRGTRRRGGGARRGPVRQEGESRGWWYGRGWTALRVDHPPVPKWISKRGYPTPARDDRNADPTRDDGSPSRQRDLSTTRAFRRHPRWSGLSGATRLPDSTSRHRNATTIDATTASATTNVLMAWTSNQGRADSLFHPLTPYATYEFTFWFYDLTNGQFGISLPSIITFVIIPSALACCLSIITSVFSL